MFALSLQSVGVRRALSAAIAVCIAVVVDHFYSMLNECWMPLITLLVMQVTVRINLRTALQRFIVMVVSVLVGSLVLLKIDNNVLVYGIGVFVFVVGCYWHNLKTSTWNVFSSPLVVAIVILMMLAPYSTTNVLYARLHDVAWGGIIGLVCGMLIFPGRADVDFRNGVMPVLRSYVEYLSALTDLLFKGVDAEKIATTKKYQVEKVLQSQQAFFPEWVYEPGFNPALQKGHRHFLIRVEQIGQVLFKMHYVARHSIDPILLAELRPSIELSVEEIKKLMLAIVTVLDLQKLDEAVSDLHDEISALEKAFKKAIPLPLELLDLSADNIYLAAFVYDLKDLQQMLLKLTEALK